MIKLALADLRRHPSRYVAVVLAVLLGVAFAVAASVFTSSMGTAFGQSAAAAYSKVDLVVEPGDGELTPDDLTTVAALPGVSVAAAPVVQWVVRSNDRMLPIRSLPPQEQRWMSLADGAWPADGEIVVDTDTAVRHSWKVGDVVSTEFTGWDDDSDTQPLTVSREYRISGLVDTDISAIAAAGDSAWSTRATVEALQPSDFLDQIHLTVPGDVEAVRSAIEAALPGTLVLTGQEATDRVLAAMTGDADAIGIILSAFVVMAAVVAVMVVASTFGILQAQRRRQLALLRCIGATTGQVRRSGLLEAVAVGVVGSVLGTVLGLAAGYGLGLLLGVNSAAFTLSPITVVVLAVAGVLLTLVAALAPTRRATRIPPLAALRPVDPAEHRVAVGRIRVWLGAILLAGGLLGLVGGTVIGLGTGLLLAVAGGIAATAGVIALLPTVLPRLLRLLNPLGRLLRTPGKLALANAGRNPGRSAVACAVLAVGVGAVTTLLVAAESASATIDKATGARNQLDLVLTADELPTDLIETVGRIDGVAATAVVGGGTVTVSVGDPDPTAPESTFTDNILVAPTVDQVLLLRNGGTLALGQAALPSWLTQTLELEAGDTVTLTGDLGSRQLVVADREMTDDGSIVVQLPDLAGIDSAAGSTSLWAKFAENADPNSILAEVNEAVGERAVTVGGSGLVRAAQSESIGQLVTIAVGLLAVALLIALVGVGNTVGLSVLERTGESGLLRALGLRRSQLRWVVALEAGALALVAAILGLVFGIGFGFAATGSVLGLNSEDLAFSVPWPTLLLIGAGAVAAGMLATALPARRAAKITPVQALAHA